MATATFVTTGGGCIDGKAATSSFPGLYQVGISYLGAGKDTQRRSIFVFDLFAISLEGVWFTSATTINSAYVRQNIQTVQGPTFTEKLDRITRADYDYLTATWNQYKSGSNWTTIGGDVDAVTPTELSYTSPSGSGTFDVTGMGPYATDGIQNRAGLVLVRMNHSTETDAGSVSQYHICDASATGKPRLVVDYDGPSAVSEGSLLVPGVQPIFQMTRVRAY